MILSEEIKEKIRKELNDFTNEYGEKTLQERQDLGAFFTPPELIIQMIEKFENLEGKILDPTCGSGQLLIGCIIAGADPKLVYGIELDPDILEIARSRLQLLGVPKINLHQGNALYEECYDFSESYDYAKAVAKAEKRLAAPQLPTTGFANFFKK